LFSRVASALYYDELKQTRKKRSFNYLLAKRTFKHSKGSDRDDERYLKTTKCEKIIQIPSV
jgi:hypothetical protein